MILWGMRGEISGKAEATFPGAKSLRLLVLRRIMRSRARTSSDLLEVERPFVIAHEWGHLAGYADESEANYIAWLTCMRGDEGAQYSAWLALLALPVILAFWEWVRGGQPIALPFDHGRQRRGGLDGPQQDRRGCLS